MHQLCRYYIFVFTRAKQSPPSDSVNNGVPDIIAAIDIGSTYSGYAFAITKDLDEDRHNIYTNKEWISGNSKLITFKAPSCVLFTPEKRLHSFGYEAEYKYGQLALDKIHTSWFYFRRFKIPVLEDEVCYYFSILRTDKYNVKKQWAKKNNHQQTLHRKQKIE